MGFLMPLVIIAIVALFVVGMVLSHKRQKALVAWAARNGLSLSPGRDRSLDACFPEFNCLHRGHSRYAKNIMRGNWSDPGDEDDPLPAGTTELTVCAFDYHYETGSGKNRTSHNFSAVIAESPVPLESLFIRPEGFFDKVTEFFGADDIDFESAEFSRVFFVKSPDKRWAYDVIHQRMMAFLLAVPRFHVQFSPRHVIAWRSSRFGPPEFGSAVRLIRGMLSRLPDYVVRRQLGET